MFKQHKGAFDKEKQQTGERVYSSGQMVADKRREQGQQDRQLWLAELGKHAATRVKRPIRPATGSLQVVTLVERRVLLPAEQQGRNGAGGERHQAMCSQPHACQMHEGMGSLSRGGASMRGEAPVERRKARGSSSGSGGAPQVVLVRHDVAVPLAHGALVHHPDLVGHLERG